MLPVVIGGKVIPPECFPFDTSSPDVRRAWALQSHLGGLLMQAGMVARYGAYPPRRILRLGFDAAARELVGPTSGRQGFLGSEAAEQAVLDCLRLALDASPLLSDSFRSAAEHAKFVGAVA